jgi:hypothetical protein
VIEVRRLRRGFLTRGPAADDDQLVIVLRLPGFPGRREAVEVLVAAHGTSSLADANRLQRLWRDVHTASHHAITEWQVNLEVYGKALLGVEPNITHLI